MKITIERSDMTDDEISNLVDCAGYGIGYWAQSGQHDEEQKTYRVSEREASGSDLPLTKTLSYDDLRDALIELNSQGKLPDWQVREFVDNDLGFDAEVADLAVQLALFGEIVYG